MVRSGGVSEVPVRGGHDADVRPLHSAVLPEPLVLAPVEETQQHRLNVARHLPDFVEKKRAALGSLHRADDAAGGPGERPGLGPEELRAK